GTPAATAATTSGWSGGVAVDVTTASAPAGRVPPGSEPTVTPSSASGARNGLSAAGSWPVTWWPIWASRVATGLIPAPPALVMCMRRRSARSMVAEVSATGVPLGEGGDVGGGLRAGPGARRGGHGVAASRGSLELGDLLHQAGAVELGVGHQDGA